MRLQSLTLFFRTIQLPAFPFCKLINIMGAWVRRTQRRLKAALAMETAPSALLTTMPTGTASGTAQHQVASFRLPLCARHQGLGVHSCEGLPLSLFWVMSSKRMATLGLSLSSVRNTYIIEPAVQGLCLILDSNRLSR
jgi:hypothetical protein